MDDKKHFTINGGVRVTELEPKLNFPFPTGDYVTLGGLINQRLGRISVVGDKVQLEGASLTVQEMDSHRITKVLFEYQIEQEPEETGLKIEDEQAVIQAADKVVEKAMDSESRKEPT